MNATEFLLVVNFLYSSIDIQSQSSTNLGLGRIVDIACDLSDNGVELHYKITPEASVEVVKTMLSQLSFVYNYDISVIDRNDSFLLLDIHINTRRNFDLKRSHKRLTTLTYSYFLLLMKIFQCVDSLLSEVDNFQINTAKHSIIIYTYKDYTDAQIEKARQIVLKKVFNKEQLPICFTNSKETLNLTARGYKAASVNGYLSDNCIEFKVGV